MRSHNKIREKLMGSFIKYYCGQWENSSDSRIDIKYKDESSVLVTLYKPGQNSPMLRPWCGNKPAVSMVGILDSESHFTLDINLSENANSFQLNLSFDITDPSYKTCIPSIIREEGEDFLEQYYALIGSLNSYIKC